MPIEEKKPTTVPWGDREYALVNGQRVAYEVTGKDRAVHVLLPGAPPVLDFHTQAERDEALKTQRRAFVRTPEQLRAEGFVVELPEPQRRRRVTK